MMPALVSAQKDVRGQAQKFHTGDIHYPNLKQISLVTGPLRSATQIWVVTRHQYGIFFSHC